MRSDIVTIAIPVCERVDFFKEALSSALNQTCQVPIIVVDNGSSHNLFFEISAEYSDRVKYYRNSMNIGMFANWNRCVQLASTEFVLILGDDDILDLTFIECFFDSYRSNNGIGIFYSNFYFLYEDTQRMELSPWCNPFGWHTTLELKQMAIDSGLAFPTISCVIKRKLLIDNPFITEVHASNDWLFIYNQLPNDVLFYGTEYPLLKYRKHSKADTNKTSVQRSCILSHFFILLDLLNQVDDFSRFKRKVILVSNIIKFYLKYNKEYRCFFKEKSYYTVLKNKMFLVEKMVYVPMACIYIIIDKFFYGKGL